MICLFRLLQVIRLQAGLTIGSRRPIVQSALGHETPHQVYRGKHHQPGWKTRKFHFARAHHPRAAAKSDPVRSGAR